MTVHVWIRIHKKVESFQANDGNQIPQLIPGDVYFMPQSNALVLEEQGAGTIRRGLITGAPEIMPATKWRRE